MTVNGVGIDGNGLGEIGDRGLLPACLEIGGSANLVTHSKVPLDRISAPATAMMFLLIVQKMRQALTFLATIENDDPGMKTLAVISILALLTISGAAYSDRLLTSDQRTAQEAN
jgi:hypothetical protein